MNLKLKKNLTLTFSLFIIMGLSLLGFASFSFAADEAFLSEEERRERRLQFNQAVEHALAKEVLKRSIRQKRPEPKVFQASVSASYGYDSNVSLNSRRDGDMFHEEVGDVKITLPHDGIKNWYGSGYYGVKFNTLFRDYNELQNFDYHTMRLTPYVRTSIFNNITLDLEYSGELLRYIRNKASNYWGQKAMVRLTQPLTKDFAHRFEFSYRKKDFTDREAFSTRGTFIKDEDRVDHFIEPGYGFLYYPSRATVMGVTGSYRMNESNDALQNLNDYTGYAINAYISQQLFEKTRVLVAGGYNFKQYDDRFVFVRDQVQEDDYFYVTTYVYYDLTDSLKILFKYLYNQNYSNNPLNNYSSSTYSLGLQGNF